MRYTGRASNEISVKEKDPSPNLHIAPKGDGNPVVGARHPKSFRQVDNINGAVPLLIRARFHVD